MIIIKTQKWDIDQSYPAAVEDNNRNKNPVVYKGQMILLQILNNIKVCQNESPHSKQAVRQSSS